MVRCPCEERKQKLNYTGELNGRQGNFCNHCHLPIANQSGLYMCAIVQLGESSDCVYYAKAPAATCPHYIMEASISVHWGGPIALIWRRLSRLPEGVKHELGV